MPTHFPLYRYSHLYCLLSLSSSSFKLKYAGSNYVWGLKHPRISLLGKNRVTGKSPINKQSKPHSL